MDGNGRRAERRGLPRFAGRRAGDCASAELYFTPVLWPDFDEDDLTATLDDFRKRQRRFGALMETGSAHVQAGI